MRSINIYFFWKIWAIESPLNSFFFIWRISCGWWTNSFAKHVLILTSCHRSPNQNLRSSSKSELVSSAAAMPQTLPTIVHTANQITIINHTNSCPNNSNHTSGISNQDLTSITRSNHWILYSGATDHVYAFMSKYNSYKKILPISVQLLDGS